MPYYNVWVEIEEVDKDGSATNQHVCLPDCIGRYANESDALARQWEIAEKYCDDPENSDAQPRETT